MKEHCPCKKNHEGRHKDEDVRPSRDENEEDARERNFFDERRFFVEHRHAGGRRERKVFPEDDPEEEVERVVRNFPRDETVEDVIDDQESHERSGQRPEVSEKRTAIFQHEIGPAKGEDEMQGSTKREGGHGNRVKSNNKKSKGQKSYKISSLLSDHLLDIPQGATCAALLFFRSVCDTVCCNGCVRIQKL